MSLLFNTGFIENTIKTTIIYLQNINLQDNVMINKYVSIATNYFITNFPTNVIRIHARDMACISFAIGLSRCYSSYIQRFIIPAIFFGLGGYHTHKVVNIML